MIDVLGTKVVTGAPAERAVLISDLHVGADGGRVLEALDAAIAVAHEQADALLVLGDLFDSYVCRGQIRVGIWRDVAARFRAAATAGLRVVVLVGNRDFLLGEEFVKASRAELVTGGYRLLLGGVDTLLVHGDELCQNDLPYQRAKRWLRHPITRWIARRLPVSLARRAAEKARRKSHDVIHSGDQTRFLPSERAMAAAFAVGMQRLVFGHIHRHSRGPFQQGVYHVLPAFDVDGVGLVVRGAEWQPMSFQRGSGQAEAVAVDMPPECVWSA
ncbi:MAG: UDP-2,3-diacylglucosamine hydrolase [Planctomycetota bacterium]